MYNVSYQHLGFVAFVGYVYDMHTRFCFPLRKLQTIFFLNNVETQLYV